MMQRQEDILKIHIKRLFDGSNYLSDVVMVITNGLIVAIESGITECDHVLNGLVVPGFVDLQVNGGGGELFNSAPSIASLHKIHSAHAKYGTTALLPTVITDDIAVMRAAADAVSLAIKENFKSILGIHFEGPHISVAKKGAHSKDFVREISDEEWELFERTDIGYKLVTLAPESVSTIDIERLTSAGVIVSLGHSDATYNCAKKALEAGARGFTHLFNAMSGISAREAGVIGSALLNDGAKCGLIVDGHHVSNANCKLALKVKPPGDIFLVTDAMPPVGTDTVEFSFFDRKVNLENGKLTSTTGELAGSVLNMAKAVKNCIECLDVTESEAIKMASLYPFTFLTECHTSQKLTALLAPNMAANFVQLDNSYNVKSTWVHGNCIHNSKISTSQSAT